MSTPRRRRLRPAVAGLTIGGAALLAAACTPPAEPTPDPLVPFQHVGTFDVRLNGNEVSEIVDSTADGRTFFYHRLRDRQHRRDRRQRPRNPLPAGRIEVGGSPTAVSVVGDEALVGVDLTTDFTAPEGKVEVVDVASRDIVRTLDLGGQPDSIAVSSDRRYAVVVLENQRDEDLDDGLIPQLPAGELIIVDLVGEPAAWTTRTVGLTDLADTAPDDPEPEFVDINAANQAVVSLQENNHLAVVDLASGTVSAHFSPPARPPRRRSTRSRRRSAPTKPATSSWSTR